MKKILLSSLFILSSFLLFAQDNVAQSFKLGLTAHPNFGWIKSDISGTEPDGLRAGFTYGLLANFYFTGNYAFSTGLKLTTINGQTKLTANVNSGNQEIYKLQYIEFPAKLKLTTNENNGMKFFGEFGLGNGFNVRAKQDLKNANGNISSKNIDIHSEISFYRASLIIGAGGEFNLGEKNALAVGLSYDNGFTDIKKGSGTLKNSYLGLNIAVFF